MLMATVAGVGLVILRVTGFTGAQAAFPVIDGERVFPVELSRRPGVCGMAGITFAFKNTRVRGRAVVAGRTGFWRSLELVLVASVAGNLHMGAGQGKGRTGVIESRLFPGLGSVAAFAIPAEFALVRVIFGMAGEAVLGGGLQIAGAVRSRVAGAAGEWRVQPFQGKSRPLVVKTTSIAIGAIVAVQAEFAKFGRMRLAECKINLQVAVLACSLLKAGIAAGMAVRTGKTCPVTFLLVAA